MTQAEATRYRSECGTHLGLVMHEINGEPACGQCRHGETMRCLAAEAISPTPEAVWRRPISPKQAAEHRAQLAAALGVENREDMWAA